MPPDGSEWCVIEPFSYDVGFESSNKRVWIPRGFVTDFASIPRIFWLVLPKWGRYGNAAVVHDYLYWEQDRITGLKDEVVSRKRADEIMLEAMEILKVPGWQRWPIYTALRAGGWLAWRQNRLNRLGGFSRVIEPGGITAETRHKRPGLLEETARAVTGKRPKLEGISRFPEELAKVVAPAVLERVLGTYGGAGGDARQGVEAGYGENDAVLAAELYAERLAKALDLQEKLEAAERRKSSLDLRRDELRRRIAALGKGAAAGKPPPTGEGKATDPPAASSKQLEKDLAKVEEEMSSIVKEIAELGGKIEHCRVDVERREAILSAIGRLGAAARDSWAGDPGMSLMLTLATERVHGLLAPVLHREDDAEAVASARMLSGAVVDLVGRRLRRESERAGVVADGELDGGEERASTAAAAPRRDRIDKDFENSAETVAEPYARNRASLALIERWLQTFQDRKEAVGHLPRIEELLSDASGERRAEEWELIDTTRVLAKSVGELRSGLQSAQLGAMSKQLESPGVQEVLQAWVLVARRVRADADGSTERAAAAASLDGLCDAITQQVAARLRSDPPSHQTGGAGSDPTDETGSDLKGKAAIEAGPVERGEAETDGERVERIATSRLLLDDAETLLGGESKGPGDREVDDLMRFFLERRKLEQRGAKQFRRDRRALWSVLLPLAPAIWLVGLRHSMKSLLQFFGVESKPEFVPPAYRELGRLARAVLLGAGCLYGLLALGTAASFFWQFRPVAADPTNPWLLGLLGVNFLACCLFLVWQALKIRLPRAREP